MDEEFLVGDLVAVPNHGTCTITARQERLVAGAVRDYFVLEVGTGQLTLFVPVDRTAEVGMRHMDRPPDP